MVDNGVADLVTESVEVGKMPAETISTKIHSFLTRRGYELRISSKGKHLYHRPRANKDQVKADLVALAEHFDMLGNFRHDRHSYKHSRTKNRVVGTFVRNRHSVVHSFESH